MSDPSYPLNPQPEPPESLIPAERKKGMSTGCIIGLAISVVGLVVLVMIAPLVSQGLLAKLRSVQAKAEIKGMEVAMKSYKTEYNRPPDLGTTNEIAFVESRGLVLDVIMDKNPAQNPRRIRFYEPPSGKGKTGSVIAPDGTFEVRDPFGNLYRLHFDWNRDGYVPDPEHPGATIAEPVIIYSAGPDGDYNTWRDNVKSWGP